MAAVPAHQLSATLRLLYSAQGDLALAQAVARTLLAEDAAAVSILDGGITVTTGLSSQSESPALSLPAAVRAHYLKSLLDWIVAQLGSTPGEQQQPEQQPSEQQDQQTTGEQKQQQEGLLRNLPQAWDLLSALLACQWAGLASTQAVRPAILTSIADTCQHANTDLSDEPAEAAVLLLAINRCLKLLLQMPEADSHQPQAHSAPDQRGSKRRAYAGPEMLSLASGSFRPGMDECISLLASLLLYPSGPLPTGPDAAQPSANAVLACSTAWHQLVLVAVQLLQAVHQRHAKPQKIFQAATGQLYGPLTGLVLVGPHGLAAHATNPKAAPLMACRAKLRNHALRLLELSLFHDSHMLMLVDMIETLSKTPSADMSSAIRRYTARLVKQARPSKKGAAVDAAAAAKVAEQADVEEADKQPKEEGTLDTEQKALVYHVELAKMVHDAVWIVFQSTGEEKQRALGVLSSVPWLLQCFCKAITRQRQLAAADAISAAWATRSSDRHRPSGKAPNRDHGKGPEKRPGADQAAVINAGASDSLAGIEFKFYYILSSFLANGIVAPKAKPVKASQKAEPKKQAQKQKVKRTQEKLSPEEAQLERHTYFILALGDLLSTVRATGAYQPTRDVSGQQRNSLQYTADVIILCYTTTGTKGIGPAADGASSGAERPSLSPLLSGCCSAVSAVLDLDHRTLQPHLGWVWHLLWTAAAMPPVPGHPLPAAAASAACRQLITAYQELRQLGFLLSSLLQALVHVTMVTPSQAQDLASAAAAVVRQPAFLSALFQAVRSIPSGQCPSVIELIAQDVPTWINSSDKLAFESDLVQGEGSIAHGRTQVLLTVAEVYSTCLSALRVDLTTAVPVANAVQQLLGSCLAAPLASQLAAACSYAAAAGDGPEKKRRKGGSEAGEVKGASDGAVGDAELALLLRLYSGLIRLHAFCASMHPEIPFLADQGPAAASHGDEAAGSAGGAAPPSTYFAAALSAAGPEAMSQLPADPLQALVRLALPRGVSAAGSAAQALRDETNARTGLATSIHSCMLQRVLMLNEQILRLSCNCRVTTVQGAKPGTAATGSAAEVQAAKELEARQLVKAMLAPVLAAAQEPGWLGGEGVLGAMAHVRAAAIQPSSADAVSRADGQLFSRLDTVRGTTDPGSTYSPVSMSVEQQSEARYICAAWQCCLSSAACWVRWAEPDELSKFLQLMVVACSLDQQGWLGAPKQSPGTGSSTGAMPAAPSSGSAAAGDADENLGTCLHQVAVGSGSLLRLLEFAQLAPVQAALPTAALQLLNGLMRQAAASFSVHQADSGPESSEERHKSKKHKRDKEKDKDRKKKRKKDEEEEGQPPPATPPAQDPSGPASSALAVLGQVLQASSSGSGSASEALCSALSAQQRSLQDGVARLQAGKGMHLGPDSSKGYAHGLSQQARSLRQLRAALQVMRGLQLACQPTQQLSLLADFSVACCSALLVLLQQLSVSEHRHHRQAASQALAAAQEALLFSADVHGLLDSRMANATRSSRAQQQRAAACTATQQPGVLLPWAASVEEYLGLVALQLDTPDASGQAASLPPASGAQAVMGTQVVTILKGCDAAASFLRAAAACAWSTAKGVWNTKEAGVVTEVEAWCQGTVTAHVKQLQSVTASYQQAGFSGVDQVQALSVHVRAQQLSVLAAETAKAGVAAHTTLVRKASGSAANETLAVVAKRFSGLLEGLHKAAAGLAVQLLTRADAAATSPRAAQPQESVSGFLLQQAAGCLLDACASTTDAFIQIKQTTAPPQPTSGKGAGPAQREEVQEANVEDGEEPDAEGRVPRSRPAKDDNGAQEDVPQDMEVDAPELGQADEGLAHGLEDKVHKQGSLLGSGAFSPGSGVWCEEQQQALEAGIQLLKRLVASCGAVSEAVSLLAPRVARLLTAASAAAPSMCSGASDTARVVMSWLLNLHLDMLALASAPSCAPLPQSGGCWGILTADVAPGPASRARQALLRSLTALLQSASQDHLKAMLGSLAYQLYTAASSSPLQDSDDPSKTASASLATAALLPRLLALLLALEEVPGPQVLAVLEAKGVLLATVLIRLLPRLQLELCAAREQGNQQLEATAAACTCCLLRSLESMMGRERSFPLSTPWVVSLLAAVSGLFPWQPQGFEEEGHITAGTSGTGALYGVLCYAASLVACLVRHRIKNLHRSMPLVLQAAGGMLQAMTIWGGDAPLPGSYKGQTLSAQGALLRCSAQLARVYESVASSGDQKRISKYCLRLLGDYIVSVANQTPVLKVDAGKYETRIAALPAASAAALQHGAFYLLEALPRGELQHLHLILGAGLGGVRRSVLASLRTEFDKQFKYEGKV